MVKIDSFGGLKSVFKFHIFIFLTCEKSVHIRLVKNWYSIFTNVKNSYQFLTNVKNWYAIFTNAKKSYQFLTNVKNWYAIFRNVKNRTNSSLMWKIGTKCSHTWKVGTKLSHMWRIGTLSSQMPMTEIVICSHMLKILLITSHDLWLQAPGWLHLSRARTCDYISISHARAERERDRVLKNIIDWNTS